MSKLVCEQCEWCGPSENKLVAVNPFNADSNIFGCPSCKEAECLYAACDEEGCCETTTCGFPIEGGYMRTCSKHYRNRNP